MDESTAIMYSEVFKILSYMDKSTVMKVPVTILEEIKKNRKKDYECTIDENDIFNKNNIKRETLAFLAYLNLNYWADEEKKKELISLYKSNEVEYEQELKEKWKDNNKELFKPKNKLEESAELIEIKKENMIIRLVKRIKQFFRK